MVKLLPAWVPSDALLVGVLGLLGALVAMNRGRWWAIDAMDVREPIIVGVGVLLAALNGQIAAGAGQGSPDVWLAVGVLIAVSGVVLWARK